MFTGTADSLVPFPDAINYYERVVTLTQQHSRKNSPSDPLTATQEFFRYYLVPGMAHCGSGPGIVGIGQGISEEPDDLLGSLQKWTEQGTAPEEIEGVGETNRSSGVTMRRKICPYPKFPTYISGDASEETSFQCKTRPRGGVDIPAARYEH
jgi:feruloyl esterase